MVIAMTKNADQRSDSDRRIHGMVSIAVPADRVSRPIFGKHGFVSGALVIDWPAIVGSAVAAHTLPLRIKFPPKERGDGVLEVKVASSAFATELQHLEPLIIERINGYFGWSAVARLKLRHGPLPQRPVATAETVASNDIDDGPRFEGVLEQVDNPALREALERLGRNIGRKGR